MPILERNKLWLTEGLLLRKAELDSELRQPGSRKQYSFYIHFCGMLKVLNTFKITWIIHIHNKQRMEKASISGILVWLTARITAGIWYEIYRMTVNYIYRHWFTFYHVVCIIRICLQGGNTLNNFVPQNLKALLSLTINFK